MHILILIHISSSSRFEDGRKSSRVLRLIGALHAAAQADEKPGAGGWRFDMLEKLAGGGERRYFRKENCFIGLEFVEEKTWIGSWRGSCDFIDILFLRTVVSEP